MPVNPIQTATNGRQFLDPADCLVAEVDMNTFIRHEAQHERYFETAHPALVFPNHEKDCFYPTLLLQMACQTRYGHELN